MALNVLMRDGGGGGTRKPTSTQTSNSESSSSTTDQSSAARRDAAKARTGSPSASTPVKPTSTSSSTPTRPRANAATRFTAKPKDEEPKKPSLSDALRANRPTVDDDGPRASRTSTSGSGESRRSARVAESAPDASEVRAAAEEVIGTPTSNNGRADNLRTGTHRGSRDERIRELRQRESELRTEEEAITEEIDAISGKIERGETTSNVVKTTVNIVTAPVTGIASLFGRSNPVADAAGGAVENMLGLERSREELRERRERLDEQQEAIEAEIKKLTDERTLNYLADVAYATGMPTQVAEYLETTDSIVVEQSTGIGSDAAYDSGTKEIIVDDDVIEALTEDIERLREDGVIDEDGRILDAARFDEHQAKNSGISTVAILAHETIHGAQDGDGVLEQAYAARDSVLEEAETVAATAPADVAETTIAEAEARAEIERIDALEYAAYVAQETLEMQAGREKQGFLTIMPDGSLQPREEAVENIAAFQNGTPLPHGPSAGMTFQGVVAENESAAQEGLRLLDLIAPGRRSPGRRSPADLAPGRRSPADAAPGEVTPGRRSPADLAPGELTPGRRSPGRRSPADLAPGRRSPADLSPGELTPGRRSPGRRSPGRRSPGEVAPGELTPGRRSPGRRSPGSVIGDPVMQAQQSTLLIPMSSASLVMEPRS